MADIPVFPAGANVGVPLQGAAPFPVQNLNPELYTEGLKAAQLQPSPLTAITHGLEQGTEFAQQTESNQLSIQNQQQNLALAPIRMRTAELQAQSQALKESVMAGTALLEGQRQASKLQSKNTINSIFSNIYSGGDLAQNLDALDRAGPMLADAGFDMTNDEKGRNVVIDGHIQGALLDLPRLAERTGNPALVKKANDIVSRFQNAANNTIAAANKNPISLLPEAPGPYIPGSVAEANVRSLDAGKVPPLDTSPAPAQQGPQAMSAGAPNPTADHLFPTAGSAPAPAFNAPTVADIEANSGVPISDRIAQHGPPDQDAEVARKTAQILQQQKALGVQPTKETVDAAGKLALEEYKNQFNLTPEQQKEVAGLRTGASELRVASDQVNQIYKTIDNITAKYGIETGKGATFQQMLRQVEAKADDSDKKAFEDAYAALDPISTQLSLKTLKEGGNIRVSTPEVQMMKGAFFSEKDKPYAYNKMAQNLLTVKADQLEDLVRINDSYMSNGKGYNSAQMAMSQFQATHPGYKPGVVDGTPVLVPDENKPNVGQWLDSQLNLSKYQTRGTNGRLTAADPVDKVSFAGHLANEIDQMGFKNASPTDVPDSQPQGANAATIRRMIGAESGGNSTAESDKGARGLMQLEDATGKKLWKDLGIPGDYNPNDKEANILMGTTYFNQMLKIFGGDTRLALAAYNAGPRPIQEAVRKANAAFGNANWATVKRFLPGDPNDKNSYQGQTVPYVERIMGDNKQRPITPQLGTAIAGLQTAKAQDNARTLLTQRGQEELQNSANAKTYEEVKGTPLGNMVHLLLSADPLSVAEAKAEEPNAQPMPSAEPTPTPTPMAPGAIPPVEENNSPSSDSGVMNFFKKAGSDIQALVMGGARTAMFGLDKDFGALVRMAALGEPYDKAVQNAELIRDSIKQLHPNLYTAGEVGGVGGMVAFGPGGLIKSGAETVGELMGTGAAAARATAAAAPRAAAATVAAREGMRTAENVVGQTVKKAILPGAAVAAAQGAGEAEGNPLTTEGIANRAEAGLAAAPAGAIIGAGIGGTISLLGKAVDLTNLRDVFAKAASKVGLAEAPVELSPGEKQVAKWIAGLPDSQRQEVATTLRGALSQQAVTGDKTAETMLANIGESNVKQQMDNVAKMANPEVGNTIQAKAAGSLDTQNSRIKKELNKWADDLESPVAMEQAAKALEARDVAMRDERRVAADAAYKDVKDSLPQQELDVGQNRKADAEGNIPPLTSKQRETAAAINAGYLPEKVPVIDDQTVQALIKGSPEAKYYVGRAQRGSAGARGLLPRESFDVLQQAKSLAYEDSQNLASSDRFRAGKAFGEIQDVLHGASPEYEAADAEYQKASDKIDARNTKLVQDLQQFSKEGGKSNLEQFGTKLFGADTLTLRRFMDAATPEEQQAIRNAARAYIENTFTNRGERAIGKTQGFPSEMLSGKNPDKLNIIFPGGGPSITKALKAEQRISGASNYMLSAGAQTAMRSAAAEGGGVTPDAVDKVTSGLSSLTGGAAKALGYVAKSVLGLPKGADVAKEAAEIMVGNPSKAVILLDKMDAEAKRLKDDDFVKQWNALRGVIQDAIAPTAVRSVAQITASKSESAKPGLRKAKAQSVQPMSDEEFFRPGLARSKNR